MGGVRRRCTPTPPAEQRSRACGRGFAPALRDPHAARVARPGRHPRRGHRGQHQLAPARRTSASAARAATAAPIHGPDKDRRPGHGTPASVRTRPLRSSTIAGTSRGALLGQRSGRSSTSLRRASNVGRGIGRCSRSDQVASTHQSSSRRPSRAFDRLAGAGEVVELPALLSLADLPVYPLTRSRSSWPLPPPESPARAELSSRGPILRSGEGDPETGNVHGRPGISPLGVPRDGRRRTPSAHQDAEPAVCGQPMAGEGHPPAHRAVGCPSGRHDRGHDDAPTEPLVVTEPPRSPTVAKTVDVRRTGSRRRRPPRSTTEANRRNCERRAPRGRHAACRGCSGNGRRHAPRGRGAARDAIVCSSRYLDEPAHETCTTAVAVVKAHQMHHVRDDDSSGGRPDLLGDVGAAGGRGQRVEGAIEHQDRHVTGVHRAARHRRVFVVGRAGQVRQPV